MCLTVICEVIAVSFCTGVSRQLLTARTPEFWTHTHTPFVLMGPAASSPGCTPMKICSDRKTFQQVLQIGLEFSIQTLTYAETRVWTRKQAYCPQFAPNNQQINSCSSNKYMWNEWITQSRAWHQWHSLNQPWQRSAYCTTWESQGSNEMHTQRATSSSRHNSEQQLKRNLKLRQILSPIVRLSPVNKPVSCHILNLGPFALSCDQHNLSQAGSTPAPAPCLCRLQTGWHGMHLRQLHSRTSLRPGFCLDLLLWPALCFTLTTGAKCFD